MLFFRRFGGWLLLAFVSWGYAAELGLTKAEVLAKYGVPMGSMSVGSREILSYTEGKITLENGRVTNSTLAETGTTTPSDRPPPRSNVNVSRSAPKWFDEIEPAKAEAKRSGRKILALFWATDVQCPWGPVFDRSVMNNPAFLNQLDPEYVLYRLIYPTGTQMVSQAEMESFKRKHDFKLSCVGDAPLPALAVVSADGRRSTYLDMGNVLAAKNGMQSFVLDALKEASIKTPANHKSALNKLVLIAAGLAGLSGLVWLIKRS